MALGSSPARGRSSSGGTSIGRVTRVDADGPYVELPRIAKGYELGPLLAIPDDLAVGDTVVVMPLAHDADSYVVLGRQDTPAPAPAVHNHDARYYTEAEVDDQIADAVDAAVASAVATATADPGLPGDIKWTAATSWSSKWQRADGTVKNRADYPDLFAKIGTTYNTGGETSAQFRLPALAGRMPAGYHSTDADFALGKQGGAKTVTLTTAQIPSHTHTGPSHSHGVTDPGHGHTLPAHTFDWGRNVGIYIQNAIAAAGAPPSNNLVTAQGSWNNALGNYTGISIQNGGTGNTGGTGGGGSHENMPPYLTLNALIRLLP